MYLSKQYLLKHAVFYQYNMYMLFYEAAKHWNKILKIRFDALLELRFVNYHVLNIFTYCAYSITKMKLVRY